MQIVIDNDLCCGDKLCTKVCPNKNFFMTEEHKANLVDASKFRCIKCGHCVAVCPKQAISSDEIACTENSGLKPNFSVEQLAQLIMTRRSIRAYNKLKVDREIIEQALEVVRYAPTGSNMQRISWSALDDAEKLHNLADLTCTWLEAMPDRAMVVANYKAGQDVILRGAPMVVVCHAPTDYWLSAQDCGIATAYLELVLHNLGLGSCWAGYVIGATKSVKAVNQLFNVPEGNAILGGVMVGYPAVHYKFIPERKPLRLTWV